MVSKVKAERTPERKAELLTAVICFVILGALTLGTLLFWNTQPYRPRTKQELKKNEIMAPEKTLTNQDIKHAYKAEAQILTFDQNGTVTLNQADWSNPLHGLWSIDNEQRIIVEISGDKLWQKRVFEVQAENIVDVESNTPWRQQ